MAKQVQGREAEHIPCTCFAMSEGIWSAYQSVTTRFANLSGDAEHQAASMMTKQAMQSALLFRFRLTQNKLAAHPALIIPEEELNGLDPKKVHSRFPADSDTPCHTHTGWG